MALLTPTQTTRGTESLFPDAAMAVRNGVVAIGSDDRHFVAADGTIPPRGVLIHDLVTAGSDLTIKRNIAVFGMYPETLQVVASGPIAAGGDVVADPANPGKVKAIPAGPGSFYVIGKSRFAVAAADDPVSLIHCVPTVVTIGAEVTFTAAPANSGAAGVAGAMSYDGNNLFLCVAQNTWVKFVAATQFLLMLALTMAALFAAPPKAKAADGDLILLQSSGTGAAVIQTVATPVAANQVLITGTSNKVLKTSGTIPLGNGALLFSSTASPVNTVASPPGSVCIAIVSGTATPYLKLVGSGTTGWAAVTTGTAQ